MNDDSPTAALRSEEILFNISLEVFRISVICGLGFAINLISTSCKPFDIKHGISSFEAKGRKPDDPLTLTRIL